MYKIKPIVFFATLGSIDHSLLSNYGENFLLADNRKFFREKITRQIVITDQESYLSLPKKIRLLPRANIVIVRDPAWSPASAEEQSLFHSVLTPWQALEKVQNVPGEKVNIFGNNDICDFFCAHIKFDELHLTSVDHWFAREKTFSPLGYSLLDNYPKRTTLKFQKGSLNEYSFSINSYAK